MSNNKQSSIEWLINELDKTIPYQHISTSQIFTDVIEQAKAMHKEEIIISHINGQSEYDQLGYRDIIRTFAEQYYNETYKDVTNDNLPPQINCK